MGAQLETGFVKCRCRHCDVPIEFQVEQAGQTVSCPQCGMETVLFVPQSKPQSPAPAKTSTVAPLPIVREGRKKNTPSLAGPIVLFVVGCGLVVNGCTLQVQGGGEISAIHQIYGAVNYCSGFVIIALAFLLDGLRNISKNQ